MQNLTINNFNSFYIDVAKLEGCLSRWHSSFHIVQYPNSSWPNVILKEEKTEINNLHLQFLSELISGDNYPKLLILEENKLNNRNVEFLMTNGFRPVGKWVNMEKRIDSEIDSEDKGSEVEGFNIKVVDLKDDMAFQKWMSIVQNVLFKNKPLNHEIFRAGIEKKLFKLLIGSYNGEATSTSLLYLGSKAGIFMVATLPTFQKKGFAKVMMLKTHTLASSLNYNNCFLQSTVEGFALYKSLNYKQLDNLILFYYNK